MVDASGKEKGNTEKGVRVCSGSFLDLHEQPFSIPTPRSTNPYVCVYELCMYVYKGCSRNKTIL